MKSKYKYLLLVIVTIITSVLIYNYVDASKPVDTEEDLLYEQNQIENKLLSNTKYNIDNPNVILNPYGISPLTAIVIFETKDLTPIDVTIKGKDGDFDITNTFIPTRLHIIPIYGLYPDFENTVIIRVNDEEKEIKIKTEKLPDGITNATQLHNLDTDKLYFTTSTDFNNYPIAYDKNGTIRWYLTKKCNWEFTRLNNGHILLSDDQFMSKPYYSSGLLEMDLLGKIYAEYNVRGGYHHETYELDNGNFLILSNNFEGGTVEDFIVEYDRLTGEIVKSFDVYDLLPNDIGYDWLKMNSVVYDNYTNSLIIAGSNQNLILNIDYASGDLNWIIGDEENIPYNLKKLGLTNKNMSVFPKNPQSLILNKNLSFINDKKQIVTYKIDYNSRTFEAIENIDLLSSDENTSLDYSDDFGYIVSQNKNIIFVKDSVKNILMTDHNLYSAKLLNVYAGETYVIAQGLRLGSIGETPTVANKFNLFSKVDETIFEKYDISLYKNVKRLVISGTFTKGDKIQIVLDNVIDKKTYDVLISETPYLKDDINTTKEKIKIESYINDENLCGKYYIYLKINDTLYKLHKYVWFR